MNVFLIDLLKLPNSLFKQSIRLPLFCASHFDLIAACSNDGNSVKQRLEYTLCGIKTVYTTVLVLCYIQVLYVLLTSSALVRVLTKSMIAASSIYKV
jgi:hypothetical protein